jgi:hypothetical protein
MAYTFLNKLCNATSSINKCCILLVVVFNSILMDINVRKARTRKTRYIVYGVLHVHVIIFYFWSLTCFWSFSNHCFFQLCILLRLKTKILLLFTHNGILIFKLSHITICFVKSIFSTYIIHFSLYQKNIIIHVSFSLFLFYPRGQDI